ncbi:MAG: CRISPR-associated protein Cas4 [Alphaproteobacteria bacterium]|jgi:CRISPR-associated exonuclease Cas4|nr:CRISPR-associated protein Cas4 [Alphaproteobacteria bacterium]
MYQEDDLLMISGIQHLAFCERQFSLIHVEEQWQENILTITGSLIHQKVDNPYIVEKRNDTITARSIKVASYKLGLTGIIDVIEFKKSDSPTNCIEIPKYKGFWQPLVMEYKRGKPKDIDCDKAQVCASAMCLEEMHNIKLEEGSIFYNATKHREPVFFTQELRDNVINYAKKMHYLYDNGITPKAILNKSCKSCSMNEICMPSLSKLNVDKYLKQIIS